MRKIKLTKGKYAIVDDEDYPYISKFTWGLRSGDDGYLYALTSIPLIRSKKYARIAMQNFIVRHKNTERIYFKNRNGLDCRKENLEVLNFKIHQYSHIKMKNKTSQYKGVNVHKGNYLSKRWVAHISKDNKTYYLGQFNSEKKAAEAYNQKARLLYGKLAYQNEILG